MAVPGTWQERARSRRDEDRGRPSGLVKLCLLEDEWLDGDRRIRIHCATRIARGGLVGHRPWPYGSCSSPACSCSSLDARTCSSLFSTSAQGSLPLFSMAAWPLFAQLVVTSFGRACCPSSLVRRTLLRSDIELTSFTSFVSASDLWSLPPSRQQPRPQRRRLPSSSQPHVLYLRHAPFFFPISSDLALVHTPSDGCLDRLSVSNSSWCPTPVPTVITFGLPSCVDLCSLRSGRRAGSLYT